MDRRSSTEMDPVQKLLLEPVPTLQEIAVLKIIATLYQNCFEENDEDEGKGDRIENYFKKFRSQLDRKVLSVGLLPAPIRELLQTHVDSIYNEIRFWMYNLINGDGFLDMFYEQMYKIAKACLQNFIWKQNGKIDDKQVARNVCKHSDLTVDEKFVIMCKFCLKDEIDGVSLVSLSPYYFDLNHHDLLILYWISYKKDELHEIQIGNFHSLDEFMLHQIIIWETWASAEFFLDRLTPEDQVSVVLHLVAEGGIIIHLKNVWAKMSHSQRSAILSFIPDKVVVVFWAQMNEFELAYAIWMQIRGFITNEQFAELIRALLEKTYYSSEDDNVALLSIDIWDSAADHLKNYVLGDKMREILPNLRRLNVKLLFVMLKYASADYRRDFIEVHRDMLVGEEGKDHSDIEKILSLCDS